MLRIAPKAVIDLPALGKYIRTPARESRTVTFFKEDNP
jgi:hypothetical protein